MAGVRHEAWYSCTRIDPPEVVKFIRQYYPSVRWAYPKISFWEGIRRYSPPLKMRRWCCDVLKKDPTKSILLNKRLMGIRVEESTKRAKRKRVEKAKIKRQTLLKPIFHWAEWHIWEFIETHGLPYPSLYDEGFHRIGCVICPWTMNPYPNAQANLRRNMERWPYMFKMFEKAVADWFNSPKRNKGGKVIPTVEQYLKNYYEAFGKLPVEAMHDLRLLHEMEAA